MYPVTFFIGVGDRQTAQALYSKDIDMTFLLLPGETVGVLSESAKVSAMRFDVGRNRYVIHLDGVLRGQRYKANGIQMTVMERHQWVLSQGWRLEELIGRWKKEIGFVRRQQVRPKKARRKGTKK